MKLSPFIPYSRFRNYFSQANKPVRICLRTDSEWFMGNLGGNESPGVSESLRFIPQGWQRVAGGRCIAETTGMVRNDNRILKG